MNIIFAVASLCTIFFGILLAFPKTFLAKINYKEYSHPDDISFRDVKWAYVIFFVLFGLSLGLVFYTGTRIEF